MSSRLITFYKQVPDQWLTCINKPFSSMFCCFFVELTETTLLSVRVLFCFRITPVSILWLMSWWLRCSVCLWHWRNACCMPLSLAPVTPADRTISNLWHYFMPPPLIYSQVNRVLQWKNWTTVFAGKGSHSTSTLPWCFVDSEFQLYTTRGTTTTKHTQNV